MTKEMTIYNAEQIDLIKRTICKGATDDELKLFLMQAQRTGLDPFSRQVFAIKRWDSSEQRKVMTMQVSIDGFRLIAERTGKYAGQGGPYWCGQDGLWKDVWLSTDPPAAAKVEIYKVGFERPFAVGTATYDQYAQRTKEGKLTEMWFKMSPIMLAKCAESLGLRKAFPQELSNLYTLEEMGQVTHDEPIQYEVAEPTPKVLPNPVKQTERPYSTAKLLDAFAKYEKTAEKMNVTISDSDRNMIAANLEAMFPDVEDKEEARKIVMNYLCGKESVKALSIPEVAAFKKWIQVRQDESGEWKPDEFSKLEALAVYLEVTGE